MKDKQGIQYVDMYILEGRMTMRMREGELEARHILDVLMTVMCYVCMYVCRSPRERAHTHSQ